MFRPNHSTLKSFWCASARSLTAAARASAAVGRLTEDGASRAVRGGEGSAELRGRGGEGSAELRRQWDGAVRTHSVEDGGVMRCSVGAASAALAKAGEGVLEARAKGNIF